MTEPRPYSLVKPTIHTPFHIDFAWWRDYDNNWRILLHSCLCAEHQDVFSNVEDDQLVDFVDPLTAEVRSIDGLQHILLTHCCKEPGFVSDDHTVVDNVFRILVSHENRPMSLVDIGSALNRPPENILKLLSGPRVFMGIRPTHS